jgi:predicted NAD/FAD-binding protein
MGLLVSNCGKLKLGEFEEMKIAVVGSGIAGLGGAWALNQHHDVTLFEREMRLGGHSRTIDITMGSELVPVDTGFIVYNERNYPNLSNLFATLGVATEPTDMSFSVTHGDFEFPRQLVSPRLFHILRGIDRFRRAVARHDEWATSSLTLIEYLRAERYPEPFIRDYLLPLAAAVWSGSGTNAGSMPLPSFLHFLANHGLFELERPQWRTVTGGSREYVERVGKELPRVLTDTGVDAVLRHPDHVELRAGGERHEFDQVVFATHPPNTLDILGSTATDRERQILGSFRYAPNRAVVHRDPSFMPRRRSTWSSWNANGTVGSDESNPVAVTYWMNRLQNLNADHPVFVTLNPASEPEEIIDDVWFAHPMFDLGTAAAQQELPSIQGLDRVWFAGAWAGYGFHEDGLQSGLTVAAALGSPAPWHDAIVPASSAATHAAPAGIPV